MKQTKTVGRDVFAIESVSGELQGTALQARKDPVNYLRDTYTVHLASPPMQLAKLTSRFSWLGMRFSIEVAGFPDFQIQGCPFNLIYMLTLRGQPFA